MKVHCQRSRCSGEKRLAPLFAVVSGLMQSLTRFDVNMERFPLAKGSIRRRSERVSIWSSMQDCMHGLEPEKINPQGSKYRPANNHHSSTNYLCSVSCADRSRTAILSDSRNESQWELCRKQAPCCDVVCNPLIFCLAS